MKRASSTYRLQLIKEVATRRDRQCSNDPMASYIQTLIDNKDESDCSVERNHRFSGSHCLLYTSPSPRDLDLSRMPSSA